MKDIHAIQTPNISGVNHKHYFLLASSGCNYPCSGFQFVNQSLKQWKINDVIVIMLCIPFISNIDILDIHELHYSFWVSC